MKLAEHTLDGFTELLASSAPAPGGGSAAALSGAVGAALTRMVAALTVGKKKYAEHEPLMKEIMEETEQVRRDLMDVLDRDTEAFNGVSAVFAMPKDTDEEKAARKAAMQEALKACTKTPFEMMELSMKALRLTEKAVGKSNQSAASDLGVAAVSLKAAIQGAWLNILINISGINDEAFVAQYREGGQAILQESLPLADRLFETIESSL